MICQLRKTSRENCDRTVTRQAVQSIAVTLESLYFVYVCMESVALHPQGEIIAQLHDLSIHYVLTAVGVEF